MATTISITPGRTWVNGETVTAAKLNCFLTEATIDSDDIVPVGTISPSFATTAPTGYIFGAGKTFGNAASSGTERANADTEDLFTLIWNNLADAQAPVSGGRGGSAAADFAANKTITSPDMRGRSLYGLDTMSGTSSANRLTNVGSNPIDGDLLGDTGGDEDLILSDTLTADLMDQADMPNVNLPVLNLVTSGSGALSGFIIDESGSAPASTFPGITSSINGGVAQTAMTVPLSVTEAGNNVSPAMIVTYIIKL